MKEEIREEEDTRDTVKNPCKETEMPFVSVQRDPSLLALEGLGEADILE